LPAPLVAAAISEFLKPIGSIGLTTTIQEGFRFEGAARLACAFDVNPVVARYRLDDLYPAEGLQLTL
jgi:hypothetical protein